MGVKNMIIVDETTIYEVDAACAEKYKNDKIKDETKTEIKTEEVK